MAIGAGASVVTVGAGGGVLATAWCELTRLTAARWRTFGAGRVAGFGAACEEVVAAAARVVVEEVEDEDPQPAANSSPRTRAVAR